MSRLPPDSGAPARQALLRPLAGLCAALGIAAGLGAQAAPAGASSGGRALATTVEDFESFFLVLGGAETLSVTDLDENSFVNGQGPGLVQDGCVYSCNAGSLQWNGQNYYGMPTQNLMANSGDGLLILQYDAPVNSVSFDLRAFQGYPDSAVVSVFDGNGALIHASAPLAVPGPAGVPFAFAAAAIGSVQIQSQSWTWSPMLDDHVFVRGGAPTLARTGACPGATRLDLTFCTAHALVAVLHGPAGTFVQSGNPCSGMTLGLRRPTLAAILGTDGSGAASLTFNAPAGACGRTVQGVDVSSCTPTNALVL